MDFQQLTLGREDQLESITKLSKQLQLRNGAVESLEMKFLKTKVGSEDILGGAPAHLPDIGNIHLQDNIAGSLTVTPHKSSYFIALNYKTSSCDFAVVLRIERMNIYI